MREVFSQQQLAETDGDLVPGSFVISCEESRFTTCCEKPAAGQHRNVDLFKFIYVVYFEDIIKHVNDGVVKICKRDDELIAGRCCRFVTRNL